jgi:ATP/ADP translocase
MFKNFSLITKEEWSKVVPSFFFIFFLMVSYYIAKPVREGLSLEVGVKSLPYMTLMVIFTVIFFNFIYDYMVQKFERRKLVITVFSILIRKFL